MVKKLVTDRDLEMRDITSIQGALNPSVEAANASQ